MSNNEKEEDKLFLLKSPKNSDTFGEQSEKKLRLIRGITTENPTPQVEGVPHATLFGSLGDRIVLVMVGLPARGKTYIARRVCQYLR